MWIGQLLVAILSVMACVYTEQVVYLNKCEDSYKCTRRISISKTFKNQVRYQHVSILYLSHFDFIQLFISKAKWHILGI